MRYLIFSLGLIVLSLNSTFAQSDFDYTLDLQPVAIANLPGLHSYAFAQHDGKWLIIGGRKDGLHARQPFNAFPQAQNNTTAYVIDVNAQQFWSSSITTLPTAIAEQLQCTNMNFHQVADTLYIIGGYSFSTTANDHKTFDNLTTVQVSSVINAIINSSSITPYFKQIADTAFAVTGGHLTKLGNEFYLVGGHRFDGRYNPMGNPTYTQAYTNQIRKFTVDNSGSGLSFANYSTITDPVHLRRRDYNLLPQIFPNGEEGMTISSGVFQLGVDLPFLYPVDITASGHTPITTFSQYLSHYHSAFACLYDSNANAMHNIFFGGMSQYYYQNGSLIQDNGVPFVKTISRLTRSADGMLQEFQLPLEMPALKGASAEFILNNQLPHTASDIIKLSAIQQDTILIGHIYGGLLSPSLNPFSVNQTSTTSADNSIYAVRLISNNPTGVQAIDGKNPYEVTLRTNQIDTDIQLSFTLSRSVPVRYFMTNNLGQIIAQGSLATSSGLNTPNITLPSNLPAQQYQLSLVFDSKYYVTKKLMKK
jgi:hypothetical protein